MDKSIGDRLKTIRKELSLTQAEMAQRLLLSHKGWQLLESPKASPGAQTLLKLAEFGFDPTWILTGNGSMRLTEEFSEAPQAPFETVSKPAPKTFEEPQNPHAVYRATVTTSGVDPELLGRVTGMVATLYRQAGIKLSHADAAKIGAPYYDRLRAMAVTGDEDERLALLGVLKVWLEKDITTTATETDNSKASA